MRALLAMVLLTALPLTADVVSRVEGRVVSDDAPVPGCTVVLSGSSIKLATISDAEGRYTFPTIPSGSYELTFELIGFETERLSIFVKVAATPITDVWLRLNDVVEAYTISCNLSFVCLDVEPKTPFDLVPCTEQLRNTELIASAERGDLAAIESLRQRYPTTYTYTERHRIAGALLGRVSDDREYWNELAEHAADAIRFAFVDGKPTQEFYHWCANRGFDPEPYHAMAIGALRIAATDRRAHAMLVQASESTDDDLVEIAEEVIEDDPR